MNRPRYRYYVGITGVTSSFQMFSARYTPTTATHGQRFGAVIGPFRTKRAAMFMADHGRGNPHCLTVADAERLCKSVNT